MNTDNPGKILSFVPNAGTVSQHKGLSPLSVSICVHLWFIALVF